MMAVDLEDKRARDRERKRLYREQNAERVRENARLYYKKNADEIKAKAKAKRAQNPESSRRAVKKWQEQNPEKHRRSYKNWHLKKKYGVTIEQYEAMLLQQGGVCAICKKPPVEGVCLSVDHNHQTGEVRGLLHSSCNLGIGNFEEDPQLMRNAADYIEAWQKGGKK